MVKWKTGFKPSYEGSGTERFPGRDVFYPGFKNCLYGRRDGTLARMGAFHSGVTADSVPPRIVSPRALSASGYCPL